MAINKNEYYPTPLKLVDKMWSYFPEELVGKEITVFDPCAGACALEHPTHLPDNTKINWTLWDLDPRAEGVEQHNALVDEWPKADLVIMNCPFSLKMDFHSRALESAPYVITLCTRLPFKEHWDCIIESGKEPSYENENLTLFEGSVNIPVFIGLMKRTEAVMSKKDKADCMFSFIDRLVGERCHVNEWKQRFKGRTMDTPIYITSASTRNVCIGKQIPKIYEVKPDTQYLKTFADKALVKEYLTSQDFKNLMYLNGVSNFIEQGCKSCWNQLPFDFVHYKKDR